MELEVHTYKHGGTEQQINYLVNANCAANLEASGDFS